MNNIAEFVIVLLMCIVSFYAGNHIGTMDGLYRGAIEYRTCMDNGAKGWYVESTEFNCIF